MSVHDVRSRVNVQAELRRPPAEAAVAPWRVYIWEAEVESGEMRGTKMNGQARSERRAYRQAARAVRKMRKLHDAVETLERSLRR